MRSAKPFRVDSFDEKKIDPLDFPDLFVVRFEKRYESDGRNIGRWRY